MQTFQDPGTPRIVVYKDEWVKSRPWCADIIWENGTIWKGWLSAFGSRKRLLQEAEAALKTSGFEAVIEFK